MANTTVSSSTTFDSGNFSKSRTKAKYKPSRSRRIAPVLSIPTYSTRFGRFSLFKLLAFSLIVFSVGCIPQNADARAVAIKPRIEPSPGSEAGQGEHHGLPPTPYAQHYRHASSMSESDSHDRESLETVHDVLLKNMSGIEKRGGSRFTFYEPQTSEGACGGWNGPNDWVVALNSAQYDNSGHCYHCLTIDYGGKRANARIVDECPGCPYKALDLSPGLFAHFADLDEGVLWGDWWYDRCWGKRELDDAYDGLQNIPLGSERSNANVEDRPSIPAEDNA